MQFLGRGLDGSPWLCRNALGLRVWLKCYRHPAESVSPLRQGGHLFPAGLDSSGGGPAGVSHCAARAGRALAQNEDEHSHNGRGSRLYWFLHLLADG